MIDAPRTNALRPVLRRAAIRLMRWHIPVTRFTRPFFRVLYGFHVAMREGSIGFMRFIWYEPLFRSRCASVGSGLQMERLPYITGAGRIVLGSDVRLSGKSSIGFGNRVFEQPEFVIGDGTFIGHDCVFVVAESITIGRHCLIAGGVRVSDFDGHPIDWELRRANKPYDKSGVRAVSIGDDVWIGAGAHVLKGVQIGARSIIGAGSIVTADVPPDSIAAGNPARIVRSLAR
jgi:carbonic anhydrase/acetyltransferase-like protein (isoleucine patch superfamily)